MADMANGAGCGRAPAREAERGTESASEAESGLEAARDVIARWAGRGVAAALGIERIPALADGRPVYEIADGGRTLRGSSPVAVCRAFYDNAKAKSAGIVTWSGRRFDAAAAFVPSREVRVEAPVRFFQALNVVTFGYSTPFWSEARWMEELDWMALHGVNMSLATIADEEIAFRVLRRFGVPEEKIEAWFPGPAHLPWFRMGNLSGYPDRLPKAWRERSVRLAGHPTLDMRRWEEMARDCAEGDEALADLYAQNARRLVTVWGPPTNDYSARMWSGLVKDFYLARLDAWWRQWDEGLPATVIDFERGYVDRGRPPAQKGLTRKR